MLNNLKGCLYKPKCYRYGFFILLSIGVLLSIIIHSDDGKTYIFYIISVIFLGIGYYNKPAWCLILLTLIVVTSRFFFIPDVEPKSHKTVFVVHLFTYLLITFISASLMKNMQKVKEEQYTLVKALANALDSRDAYTLYHSENVAKYAVKIAKKMNLSNETCEIIRLGGLLHDIGKIGIPEQILFKTSKLTDNEYALIKTHPVIGYNMIKHVSSFKENGILDIVLYHHERMDGKGYPKGLKGDGIPLVARIVAIADSFDAMTSKRIYRDQQNLEYAFQEILKNKGTQFDPEIADVFLSLFSEEDDFYDKKRIKYTVGSEL